MTVGVIWVGHQCEDYAERSLAPWIAARAAKLGGHEFIICAVSVPFTGFQQDGKPDRTRAILGCHLTDDKIDHAIVSDKPMAETDARGAALRWLVDKGVDTLFQWDSDEFATTEQLSRILAFWEARPGICWARLSYKNRVFTPNQYLVEPFTPPRIHRVRAPGSSYEARSFYEDNGIAYHGTITRDIVPDAHFPSVTVPRSVAWVDHWSWMSDSRGRAKCRYQWARWKRCDFDWDDARGGLIWRDGQPVPETAQD